MSSSPDFESSSEEQNLVDLVSEEFVRRKRAGETTSVDEYVAKHPNIADQLRTVLPTLMILEDVRPAQAATESQAMPAQVGDYRLIRKIGQGGMGVVYEAEQEALGRRVALKLLPTSVSQDPKLLERFRREARAAAKLHHTNIVPVFDVGQDGETSYFAMQYIEGRGLDQVLEELLHIREQGDEASSQVFSSKSGEADASSSSSDSKRRQAFFKSVARLGADVAAALSYAHERNIVHRDVKPSNLLLDNSGVVWLADFGLAKTQDMELTATGDFVGTARYMSPERFKSEGDHRVDIYALGMTLYELATSRRAFDAADRLQLIEQIANLEPRRPREIDRHLPLDLETIILKAMDKEPKRRYQSAAEMLADLNRFCDDQSIAARRTTPVERLVRWGRRNKAVSAAIALMAILIIVLSLGSYEILRQRNTAETNLQESIRQEGEAKKNLELAVEQQRIAEANMQKAIDAVSTYYTTVSQETLLNEPRMEGLRSKLLESATDFFSEFFAERRDDEQLKTFYLDALYNFAVIEDATAKESQAPGRFAEVLQGLKPDIATTEDRERLSIFIKATVALSSIRIREGKGEQANALVEAALPVADRFVALEPGEVLPRILRAYLTNKRIAYVANSGRLQESLRLAEQARDKLREGESEEDLLVKDYLDEVGLAHRMVGSLKTGLGKYQESIENYQASLDSFQKALELEPESAQTRWYASDQLTNIALMKNRTGKIDACIEYNQRALEILETLVTDFPLAKHYREALANSYASLGSAHWGNQDYDRALEIFEKSRELRKAIFEDRPENVENRMRYARIHQNIALTLTRMNREADAETFYRDGVRIGREACAADNSNPKYLSDLTRLQSGLAGNLTAQGKFDQAKILLEECLEFALNQYEQHSQVVEVGLAVVASGNPLSELYERLDEPDEAARVLDIAIEKGKEVLERAPENQPVQRQLNVSYFRRAGLFIKLEDLEAASASIESSLELAPNEQRRTLSLARQLVIRSLQTKADAGEIRDFIQELVPESLEHSKLRVELARLAASQLTESIEGQEEWITAVKEHFDVAINNDYFDDSADLEAHLSEAVFDSFRSSNEYPAWFEAANKSLVGEELEQ
ncbi:MAG: serine/threonine-protein kinase [Planctomycetota bacterium]